MQLTIDFTPGLTQQFKSLRQVTAAVVYSAPKGMGTVAADCDMSPSELSKQLNKGDEFRKLDVDDFEKILEATRDWRPIYYLIAKFLPDDDMRRRAAFSRLEQLLPEIESALRDVQQHPPKAAG